MMQDVPGFIKRLRELEEKSGLSQVKFSKSLGLKTMTYRNILSGARGPYLDTLLDILTNLGKTTGHWLLTGESEKEEGGTTPTTNTVPETATSSGEGESGKEPDVDDEFEFDDLSLVEQRALVNEFLDGMSPELQEAFIEEMLESHSHFKIFVKKRRERQAKDATQPAKADSRGQ